MWVPVVDRTKRVKPFLACGVPNRKVHLPKKNRMEHLNMDLFCGCLLITCCPLTVTFLFMNAAWKIESVGFSMHVKFPGTFFIVFGQEKHPFVALSMFLLTPRLAWRAGPWKVFLFSAHFSLRQKWQNHPTILQKGGKDKEKVGEKKVLTCRVLRCFDSNLFSTYRSTVEVFPTHPTGWH